MKLQEVVPIDTDAADGWLPRLVWGPVPVIAASTTTDPKDEAPAADGHQSVLATPCRCCGGRMIVIETFEAGCQPRHAETIRIDTS